MRLRREMALTSMAAFVLAAPLDAQSVGESRAAILLTLPSSARALALGEGWGAIADDESALFYNPAQLARVRGLAIGGSAQAYFASTTLAALAGAIPIGRGTFALGLQALDYGSEPEIIPGDTPDGQTGTPTGGTVSAQDIAITAGYGVGLGSRRQLRLGAGITWVRQHVADVSGSSVAADAGVAYSMRNGWELSGALQHMGPPLTLAAVSAPLPWTWRVAVAAPIVRAGTFTLQPMAEAREASGNATNGVLAAEATWRPSRDGPVLAGRVGYAFHDSGDDRSPITAGGGITLGRITVDYAYEGFELLGGATHRVGVRFAAPPRAQ